MRVAAGAVYTTVALVVGLAVVSGPIVGAVDFTRDRTDVSTLGTGSITVEEVSVPSSARLDPGYRSDSYSMAVPDARIYASSITGRPIVEYSLEVAALNYSHSMSHFLDDTMVGWIRLQMAPGPFPSERIDRDRYDGTLSVVVRVNDTERVLHRKSIPIEVRG